MDRRFELVENERRKFVAPVQFRWTQADGTLQSASGETIDVSIYGLSVFVEMQIDRNTELIVSISDTVLCGTGNVRYCNPVTNGFRTGLQFQNALVMQGIPELDVLLMNSLKPVAKDQLRKLLSLRLIPRSVGRMLQVGAGR